MLKENIINCTGTVSHYSLDNLKGVLKPSLGLVLIDPESSYSIFISSIELDKKFNYLVLSHIVA